MLIESQFGPNDSSNGTCKGHCEREARCLIVLGVAKSLVREGHCEREAKCLIVPGVAKCLVREGHCEREAKCLIVPDVVTM